MRRWTIIATAFVAGLAMAVAGFVLGGDALACEVSGQLFCSSSALSEELLIGGLCLVAVALLTAVVTTARDLH
jgi:hypothetical protein